ncbi:hypothetical protein [Kibdelosporangium aridum]|nr:hypothetical protein [Kibdelosporangium aridum]
MELTADERAKLRALVNRPDVAATIATRARIAVPNYCGNAGEHPFRGHAERARSSPGE